MPFKSDPVGPRVSVWDEGTPPLLERPSHQPNQAARSDGQPAARVFVPIIGLQRVRSGDISPTPKFTASCVLDRQRLSLFFSQPCFVSHQNSPLKFTQTQTHSNSLTKIYPREADAFTLVVLAEFGADSFPGEGSSLGTRAKSQIKTGAIRTKSLTYGYRNVKSIQGGFHTVTHNLQQHTLKTRHALIPKIRLFGTVISIALKIFFALKNR